jgi:hypothetical protein
LTIHFPATFPYVNSKVASQEKIKKSDFRNFRKIPATFLRIVSYVHVKWAPWHHGMARP